MQYDAEFTILLLCRERYALVRYPKQTLAHYTYASRGQVGSGPTNPAMLERGNMDAAKLAKAFTSKGLDLSAACRVSPPLPLLDTNMISL